ncbi:MAG: hypothetical protein HY726_00865 [Candidatus Rokubacteria bacterium]|nr:hypothetical protein [Candidatus Rokubacteria bacterium]
MEWVIGLLVVVGAGLVAVGGWFLGRRVLQLCPHCGWIVRRVRTGWLRCPRCHRQYGRHARARP